MKKALVLLGLVSILSFSIVSVADATMTSKSRECPIVGGYSGCE